MSSKITVQGRVILVEQHYSDEFTAVDDQTYDGPGSAIGSGKTQDEAVADLFEKMEERGTLRHITFAADVTDTDGYTFGGFVR